MKKISVVVLAKNEKDELENCLKSVSFASEIIIIGDNLGNETKLIARKYFIQRSPLFDVARLPT